MPKRYPPEFRRKVLDLVAEGRRVSEVARDLGIPDQTILRLAPPGRDRPRCRGRADEHRARRARRCPQAHRAAGDRARGRPPGDGAASGEGAPKRRFEVIEKVAGERLPAEVACRLLGASVSGYYG